MKSCPACGAELTSALVCEVCHELIDADGAGPFAAFGLEPGFVLDPGALRKRHLRLSRELHPDFHGASAPEVRARAEANSAALNEALAILSDDERRANWLVGSLGGPAGEEERQMPQEFLMDVLDWNTAIEEARHAEPESEERRALAGLKDDLVEAREERHGVLTELLDPLPPSGSPDLVRVRRQLNALRYLARSLHEIAELELSFQKSTT